MTYKYSKKSKELERWEEEERKEETTRPDPNQNIQEVLNETDEEINKKTETPEHREERKQELQRRRMQSTGKTAIYYPKGDD